MQQNNIIYASGNLKAYSRDEISATFSAYFNKEYASELINHIHKMRSPSLAELAKHIYTLHESGEEPLPSVISSNCKRIAFLATFVHGAGNTGFNILDATKSLESIKKNITEKPSISTSDSPDEIIECIIQITRDYNQKYSYNPMAYRRGGIIVFIQDVDGKAKIDTFTEIHYRERLQGIALFNNKFKNGTVRQVTPPHDYVRLICAKLDPPFPLLNGIKYHPYISKDGKAVTVQGYNSVTGHYLFSKRKRNIQRLSNEDAKCIIDDILSDFPFQTDADKANLIAAVMNLIVSEYHGGRSPIFISEAASPGTGKTLSIEVTLFPVFDEEPSITPEITDNSEFTKNLTAWNLEGREP